jgi:hypothetical protein
MQTNTAENITTEHPNPTREYSEGLLKSFIDEKTARYVAPAPRQRVPHGAKKGFSAPKYHATLWALTSREQKQVAEEVGVSYGVMRQWMGEPDFQRQIEAHRQDFIDCFLAHVQTLPDTVPDSMDAPGWLADARLYDVAVLDGILRRLDAVEGGAGGHVPFDTKVFYWVAAIADRQSDTKAINKFRLHLQATRIYGLGLLTKELVRRTPDIPPKPKQRVTTTLEKIVEAAVDMDRAIEQWGGQPLRGAFPSGVTCEICNAEPAFSFSLIPKGESRYVWSFTGNCTSDEERYYIEFHRFFRSPAAVTSWLGHLAEKTSFNPADFFAMLHRFAAASNSYGEE